MMWMAGVEWVAGPCLVGLGIALLLTLYRLVRGPHLADRIAALDLMALIMIAVALIRALETGSAFWIDVGIVTMVIGVLGSVAIARYMIRR